MPFYKQTDSATGKVTYTTAPDFSTFVDANAPDAVKKAVKTLSDFVDAALVPGTASEAEHAQSALGSLTSALNKLVR
jgi:hypothetical protein